MTTNLVFVYGALLSPSYLNGLVVDAHFVRTGNAEGWQLEFGTTAIMVEKEDATVFGALYEVSDTSLRRLDRAADDDLQRIAITVDTASEESVVAQAYVSTAEAAARLPGSPPTHLYLDAVERGYSAHNAPLAAWNQLRLAADRAIEARRRDDRLALAEEATWD